MTSYVALLRGINVGGNNRIAMADLRRWIEALGYESVATYIQSGNVVLSGPSRTTSEVAAAVRAAIQGGCGLDVAVMVRTREDLAQVVAGNPYPEADDEPTKVHVAFLTDEPDLAGLEAVDAASYAPDEWAAGPGVLYLRFPTGRRAPSSRWSWPGSAPGSCPPCATGAPSRSSWSSLPPPDSSAMIRAVLPAVRRGQDRGRPGVDQPRSAPTARMRSPMPCQLQCFSTVRRAAAEARAVCSGDSSSSAPSLVARSVALPRSKEHR